MKLTKELEDDMIYDFPLKLRDLLEKSLETGHENQNAPQIKPGGAT